jgi:hypothetical protein
MPKRRVGEIPHRIVNKQATGEGRSGGTHPATKRGKACKRGGVKKTPQEEGKANFPHEL